MYKNLLKNEDGSVLVFTVILIPVIIALGGLLIDFGLVSVEKSKLSNAVDSAAWAALDSYDKEKWEEEGEVELIEERAYQLADQYLKANLPHATLLNVYIEENQVEVEAESVTKLYFMTLFGIREVTVKTSATKKIG